MNTFSKRCKINIQKSLAFLYIMNSPEKQILKEIRKTIPFTISSKIQISRNKFIKGSEKSIQ
jgi:hypothetical protein